MSKTAADDKKAGNTTSKCPDCEFDGTQILNEDGTQKWPNGYGLETMILPEVDTKTKKPVNMKWTRHRCPACGKQEEWKKAGVVS